MIFLDNASTTPICDAARNSIIEHLDDFGNPSSNHELGRKARLLIEDARERIARCINAEPNEIYFTSGGSEANTWALHQKDVLASNIEHHSIVPDAIVRVNSDGFIEPNILDRTLENYSEMVWDLFDIAVSCMYVNNEIGTIQPIKEIADVVHNHKAMLHIDAVQAVGHIPVDVKALNCDTLSASGHKFYAPKGVGFLYVKSGTSIDKFIKGGAQENNMRGGTENVLGIISMAAALENAIEHMKERNVHVKYLRDKMLYKLLQIPNSHVNGSLDDRIVSNINIRFDGVSGARLVSLCSLYDICISSGSACNEGTPTPSHVLKAIGLSDEEALSSMRITIGHQNTEEEIDYAADIITKLVERIREDEEI